MGRMTKGQDITVKEIEQGLRRFALGLSIWSPGDGWTRYKVTNLEGSRDFTNNMNLAELRAWYKGYMFRADAIL